MEIFLENCKIKIDKNKTCIFIPCSQAVPCVNLTFTLSYFIVHVVLSSDNEISQLARTFKYCNIERFRLEKILKITEFTY